MIMETAAATETIYRSADARTILAQLGRWTAMSVGLRELIDMGYGIQGRIGIGNPCYKLQIFLLGNDTYQVNIIRRIGGRASLNFVNEFTADGIYCDQLAEVVNDAWCGVMERKGR